MFRTETERAQEVLTIPLPLATSCLPRAPFHLSSPAPLPAKIKTLAARDKTKKNKKRRRVEGDYEPFAKTKTHAVRHLNQKTKTRC